MLAAADPFTERVQKGDKAYYRARFAGFDKATAEADLQTSQAQRDRVHGAKELSQRFAHEMQLFESARQVSRAGSTGQRNGTSFTDGMPRDGSCVGNFSDGGEAGHPWLH